MVHRVLLMLQRRMTSDTRYLDVYSLDGYESPRHSTDKEERLHSARECRSKVDDASEVCSTTVDTATTHGHEWNDEFGFNAERGNKATYGWASERINVAKSGMSATTPGSMPAFRQGSEL